MTLVARISLTGLLFVAVAHAAAASLGDRGPTTAVATVRHDLPLLLAAMFEDKREKPSIDWVVTDDKDAIAKWRSAQHQGVVALRLYFGRWWWRAAAISSIHASPSWTPMLAPGYGLGQCGLQVYDPPSVAALLAAGFIDETLAKELSGRLQATTTQHSVVTIMQCHMIPIDSISGSGGFDATFFHKEDYGSAWFDWIAWAPETTSSDREPSYAFTVKALPHDPSDLVQTVYRVLFPTPPPILKFDDSTVDVWFPYVLTNDTRYTLSLSNVTPELRDIPATLRNNVLHFLLPEFSLQLGEVAHGEIDGDAAETAVPAQSPSRCANLEVSVKKPAPLGLPGSFPRARPNLPDVVVADVFVVVNPDGSVRSASLQRSSGNPSQDEDAIKAAYATAYNPKEVNCVPAQGTYLYRAVWVTEHST